MMLKNHAGDCSIYASLCNNVPEAGICTCGYGYEYQEAGLPQAVKQVAGGQEHGPAEAVGQAVIQEYDDGEEDGVDERIKKHPKLFY